MSNKSARKRHTINQEKVIHNAMRSIVEAKLIEIRQYYTELERHFETQKQQILNGYNKELARKPLDPESEREIAEYYSEEHFKIDDIFVTNFRYSIVVSIYSVLEVILNDLCHYLHRSKKLLLTLDELKGEGIERSKLYLTKVCMVAFPENSHEWQEIIKFHTIRNCIVHAQGNVKQVKSPGKIESTIENTKGVDLDATTNRFIRIESSYISAIITYIEEFIHQVHKEAFKIISAAKPSCG